MKRLNHPLEHAVRNQIADAVSNFIQTADNGYWKLACTIADMEDENEFLNWVLRYLW